MNPKKKLIVKLVGGALAAALVIGGLFYFLGSGGSSGNDKVYCQTIKEIMGQQSLSSNRFAGKIEASQTEKVERDFSKEIAEVLVHVGDRINKGQALFKYDTSDIQNQIAMCQVDIDGAYNNIELYQSQINQLRNSGDDSAIYSIQEKEMMIEQERNTVSRAKTEIERYNQEIAKAIVYSKMDGVLKEINEESYDMYGNSKPYMLIMSNGDYRVKMAVDEMNIPYLSVDMDVTVRSRVDESVTWSGKISLIDTNSTVTNENNYYYGGSSQEQATQYPVYVTLDSTENLLLGQHVFVELGVTQEKTGLWLDASYVFFEGDNAYVWKANSKSKLVKQKVLLSELDEETYQYQIVEGLTDTDRICWPMPSLYEGVTVVDSPEEVDYSSDIYQSDASIDDGSFNVEDGEAIFEEVTETFEGEIIPEQTFETTEEGTNDDTPAE